MFLIIVCDKEEILKLLKLNLQVQSIAERKGGGSGPTLGSAFGLALTTQDVIWYARASASDPFRLLHTNRCSYFSSTNHHMNGNRAWAVHIFTTVIFYLDVAHLHLDLQYNSVSD